MAAWRRRGLPAMMLTPLALCFGIVTSLRRCLYRCGLMRSVRLPVPVVVVGNILVGGVGKTPLTLHLIDELRRAGRRPGVVARGYGANIAGVRLVDESCGAAEVGDEPLLIARRSGVPVAVGRDRVTAAQAVLAAHPDVDVLLSDDGLQHYRLARDIEIVVCDARGLMNGWLLPAGPLREPARRLRTVDAVVYNGIAPPSPSADSFAQPSDGVRLGAVLLATPDAVLPAPTLRVPSFQMRLVADNCYRLNAPELIASPARFVGQTVHALAGIGDPQRFFAQLEALGIRAVPHPFPDHHAYAPSDLPSDGQPVLTTEKDAVKLAALPLPPDADIWVLPVHCQLDPDTLTACILEKLRGFPPA